MALLKSELPIVGERAIVVNVDVAHLETSLCQKLVIHVGYEYCLGYSDTRLAKSL